MLRTDLDPLPKQRSGSSVPASNFAVAVQSIEASTITTDTEGLVARSITIHSDAKAEMDILILFAKIVLKAPHAQVMSDIVACVAWAAGHGGDLSKLGITGFCWGGLITWLYSAHTPALKAGVAWYGRLTGVKSERQTSYPLDEAAALKAPVLGLYGGIDNGIPLDSVEAMRKALASGGGAARRSEIVVYRAANHAFFADYRPNYDKAAAEDGWKRCLDWLRGHGVA